MGRCPMPSILCRSSLLAGHSMGSAIEMIAEQSPQPLAAEFVQVFQQQRLGLQFRDALLQMGSRVPSRDLQFLITAILVQKETGGDLTEILARPRTLSGSGCALKAKCVRGLRRGD